MLPQYGQRAGGLHFRVFGFPVRVDPFFFFIVVALGFATHSTVGGMVAWFAVVFVSILIHELGHAFAARAVGSDAIGIELQSMGGLTAYRPRRTLSRLEQIGVSLAGPFSGFALGTVALVLAHLLDVSMTRSGDNVVLFDLLWVNFGWGLFNLLPVLPLDGGMVMQNLMPGDENVRGRRAALLSIAILIAAAVISIRMEFFFGVIYAALLAAFNVSILSRGRGMRVEHDGGDDAAAAFDQLEQGDLTALPALGELARNAPTSELRSLLKSRTVESLVRQGRIPEARAVLHSFPGQTGPSLYALVDAVEGVPHGLAMLDEQLSRSADPATARHAILGRVLTHRAGEIPGLFTSLPPTARSLDALREAQYLAHVRGDFRDAAMIGEQIVQQYPQAADAWIMYNTACSWARAGETERAFGWLTHAVDSGWNDLNQLSSDHDLAALWNDARFHQLRARLGG
ncbi:MAG TPA: M50 family metallopeptidase [Acidimicrobiales bacterium]|nr:M50 family metallopeptidase [Acidimicrobiales bacterium]